MIVFKKVRFRNFKSYGSAWSEVDLNRDQLTAILGQNGGGKSTILDAINFALYGKSFNSAQKSKIINSINGKNCAVELEFETNGSDYRVVRGMKPSVFEIYRNGKLITQSANAKDYQSILEKQILKMSMKNFTQTVLVGMASFIPFMELSATDRRTIIENILGVGILTTMNGILKTKIQQNDSDLNEINHELAKIRIKLDSEKLLIETLKKNHIVNAEKIEAKISGNEAEISKHEEKLKKLSEAYSKSGLLSDKYRKFKEQETALLSDKSSLASSIKSANKDIRFVTSHDNCPFCKQGISGEHKRMISENLGKEVETTTKKLDEIASKLEKMAEKGKRFAEAMDKMNAVSSKISEENTAISMLNREISNLRKELSKSETLDDVKEHEDNVRSLASDARERIEAKRDLVQKDAVMSMATVLLKDSGIKTAVVNQYLPTINRLVNQYLADMDFFLSFELDSQFNETIKARDRDDFTYQNLSQGERRRLDLAILFTWRRIAMLRNSCATNLLVVDEVLDSSLDEEGINMAMNLFRSFKDSNIFVISHRETIQDARFDRIIRIRKERQFSVISED